MLTLSTLWTFPDSLHSLQTGSRARRCSATMKVREDVACLWVEIYGQSGRALAARLRMQPPAISKVARRGAVDAARWTPLIAALRKDT